MEWQCPPVSAEKLRAAGFTWESAGFPRSEMGARWIAWFNGISLNKISAAWCYASNEHMRQFAENAALEAISG